MRSSVREDDPGYKNFQVGKHEIFLDGKPVSLCITADEEEGFVLCFEPDENGKPYYDSERDIVPEKIMYGKVEILEKHQL